MNQAFEEIGMWWLPGAEDSEVWNNVPGVLEFSPIDGAKLRLFGHLMESEYFQRSTEYELLHGATTSGKLITLQGCHQLGMEYPQPGVPTRRFSVDIVYEGELFGSSDSIRFNSIEVEYTNLHNWIGRTAFKIDDDAQERSRFGTTIQVETPERIEWLNHGSNSIAIDFGLKKVPVGTWEERGSLLIEQTTYVEIQDAAPEVFTRWHSMLYYIHNFLSLGMLERVYMISLRGYVDVSDKRKVVKIYYKQLRAYADPVELEGHKMLFTFNRLGNRAGNMLAQWVIRGEKLHSLYDMYFATMYASSMYLEHRFLSMVQACESYARLVWNGPNKFTFRAGIESIVDRLSPITSITMPDKEKFLDMVRDSRNYYTHRNVDETAKAATGLDLVLITNELKRMIEMCFLLEIGFDLAEIEEMIRAHYRIR